MKYIVEGKIHDKSGHQKNPDIIASSEIGWVVIDISNDQKSKTGQLTSYLEIEPKYLSTWGLNIHNNEPDVISSRLEFIDDGPFCQLLLNDTVEVNNITNLKNSIINDHIRDLIGEDVSKLPNIPITLLPEMTDKEEIRRGLIDIVMNIFEPNSEGKTLNQIVDEGLERLSPSVVHSARQSLLDKVRTQMDILVREHMPNYLKLEGDRYRATEKFKVNHNTLGKISSILAEWSGQQYQKTLGDF